MPVQVSWYEPEHIILYTASDPLTIEDMEAASEHVWSLASGIPDLVDLIFDYRAATEFPRKMVSVMREGSFRLPTLERVALVGSEPLIEMMFSTLTQNTFRPDPTIHTTVEDAAAYLRKMAQEDNNR